MADKINQNQCRDLKKFISDILFIYYRHAKSLSNFSRRRTPNPEVSGSNSVGCKIFLRSLHFSSLEWNPGNSR